MYRIVKSKNPVTYAIHKIAKVENGETYIEGEAIIKANSLFELRRLLVAINASHKKSVLDRAKVIILHKTLWHEEDMHIPFFEDVVEEVLEDEFEDKQEMFGDESYEKY